MGIKKVTTYSTYILALLMLACTSEKKFQISGEISSGENETLYLEHRDLDGIKVLDSTVLKKGGAFHFKEKAPQNPEFYQLRIKESTAVFAIDSVETIKINADAKDLRKSFIVANSPVNDQIKRVDVLTANVKKEIAQAEKKHSHDTFSDVEYIEALDSLLNGYKTEVTKIVLGSPASAAAYYAIFQKINDYLIFDPYDKKDYAMFGAVATSWDRYYKDTPRTKHLYDFTMKALKTRKQQEQHAALLENAPIVTDASLPDINLKSINGEKIALSTLKGKVVVLDFTVYNAEFSYKHNFDLNKVYQSFKNKGVEIYQISLDSDEHFWKNAANNLPWITVHDPQSVYSRLLGTYNVRNIPTTFIINREGDIVARIENYQTLGNQLERFL